MPACSQSLRLGIPSTTLQDRRLVKLVVHLVGRRSAHLAATGIAAIILHLGREVVFQRESCCCTCTRACVERVTLNRLFIAAWDVSKEQSVADALQNKPTTVAIDGSVFEHYPYYAAMMKEALLMLLGEKANLVNLKLSKDGSGIGAALIAAVTK